MTQNQPVHEAGNPHGCPCGHEEQNASERPPVVASAAHIDPVGVDLDSIEGRLAFGGTLYRGHVEALVAEVRRLREREAALTRSLDAEIQSTARKVADDAAEYAQDVTGLLSEQDTLVAAITQVHALHQPDEDGFCRSCRTMPHPCPTALAIGDDDRVIESPSGWIGA